MRLLSRLAFAWRRFRLGLPLVVLLLPGCGASAFDVARQSLATGAALVRDTDVDLARGYTDASRIAYTQAVSAADYRAHMSDWDAVAAAQTATKAALLGAEAAVDAAEAADNEAGLFPILGCVAQALRHFTDALVEVGVPVPAAAASLVHALSQYTDCAQEVRR